MREFFDSVNWNAVYAIGSAIGIAVSLLKFARGAGAWQKGVEDKFDAGQAKFAAVETKVDQVLDGQEHLRRIVAKHGRKLCAIEEILPPRPPATCKFPATSGFVSVSPSPRPLAPGP